MGFFYSNHVCLNVFRAVAAKAQVARLLPSCAELQPEEQEILDMTNVLRMYHVHEELALIPRNVRSNHVALQITSGSLAHCSSWTRVEGCRSALSGHRFSASVSFRVNDAIVSTCTG